MDFSILDDSEKQKYTDLMFGALSSAQEIKDWAMFFLGLDIPLEITDPDSNSSPLDAIWQIYETFKNNSGDKNPGYILMSCREGMKCQKKGTKIICLNSLKNIEDVKEGDIIWTGFSWQKVTKTFYEGMKPGLTINVDGGFKVTGTPIHRYWCLRNGKEQWIASKDLNPKTDLICLNLDINFSPSKSCVETKEYAIGYFLGLLVGNGDLSLIDKHNKFILTNTNPHITKFYITFCKEYFPNGKLNILKNSIEFITYNKKEINLLKSWDLSHSYLWGKRVPSFIYSHIDSIKGFIAGLFDTKMSWSKNGDGFLKTVDSSFFNEIQIILAALGIESRVEHNQEKYKLQKHLISKLIINQAELRKLEKINIILKSKKITKNNNPKSYNYKDVLPYSQIKDLLNISDKYSKLTKNNKYKKPIIKQCNRGITYDKIAKLITWMDKNIANGLTTKEDTEVVNRYKKILLNKWKTFNVEDAGLQYFYDLTVENEHSYWSNGLISHNTISVAILELLLLLHFQLEIGHAAATEEQSSVGLGYIENFLLKVEPLMTKAGWENITQNKRVFRFKTPQGKQPFIKIVICNPKGMNSLHANVLFLDELDLADPKALKEGVNIVGYSKGIHGVKVYLSTRKYAFGNMAQAIEKAPQMNYKIVNWNIIDVTERCPKERHLPDQPKEDRYVLKNLPLQQISKEEYEAIPDIEKSKWELIPQAYAGCAKCPLLPVCKGRLAKKPETATGGFYKPISSIIQKFAENDADTAEAQLMCWKPGSAGLVYPRFVSTPGKGNVITTKEAYESLFGPTKRVITDITLIQEMKNLGISFYAGVDWGYIHDFVIVICAVLPNEEVWLMETYAAPGLEFVDQLEIAKTFRDKYNVVKWFADTAYPQHIKSFIKNGMKCPPFTKDVFGGIEAVRSKITNASGKRLFKVILNESNKKAISAISKHRFQLDGQGNVTLKPDDERGIADICDALRYIGQNVWPVKGSFRPDVVWTEEQLKDVQQSTNPTHSQQMKEEIAKRVADTPKGTRGTGKKGGFYWNMD